MKIKSSKIKDKKQEGFTVVELLVASTIFIIIMAVASGSFISALRTQGILKSMIDVNNNISLTLEQMAREMRTGYSFCKISPAIFEGLQFVNAKYEVVRYRLKEGILERGISASFGNPEDNICSGDFDTWFDFKEMTSDTVKITDFHTEIFGNELGDNYPPRIVMVLSATSADPAVQRLNIFTNIQTTVSARCGAFSCPSDI